MNGEKRFFYDDVHTMQPGGDTLGQAVAQLILDEGLVEKGFLRSSCRHQTLSRDIRFEMDSDPSVAWSIPTDAGGSQTR